MITIMSSVLIMLIASLLAAFALGAICNRKIEECIPVIMLGTVVCLYVFYCLNLLAVGRILVYVLYALLIVLAALIMTGRLTLRQSSEPGVNRRADYRITDIMSARDVLFSRLLTPGVVLLIGISILFLIYASRLNPSVWDELRLWAAMPKALHYSEALQVGQGSLLYSTMQSYPPGMALLVYYFTALPGSFSYSSIFAVYWIFMAALVLPALKHLSWKQWYVIPIVFFLLIVIPVLLTVNGRDASGDWNFFFASLYIDPMLGCLLGYAFYQAIKDPAESVFSLVGFSLTLFVLPSFKNIGTMYALVAIAMAVAVRILNNREKAGAERMSSNAGVQGAGASKAKSGFSLKQIIILVIPLAAVVVSYYSWQLIIHTKGTGEFIDFQLTSFTGERFANVLKGMTTWGHIPFLYYALFFILFGLFMTFVLKDISRKTYLVSAAGFLLAFAIFFYGYTSHYGLMLSSIHRYTSTFTFAAFIYLMMRFFARFHPKAIFTFRGKIIEDNYQEFRRDHAADEEELKEIAAEESKWADAGFNLSRQVSEKTKRAATAMDGDAQRAETVPDGDAKWAETVPDGDAKRAETAVDGDAQQANPEEDGKMTRAEARAISKSVILNILPSKPVNAGRLLFIELLLMLVACLLLFNSRNLQLENASMKDAAAVIEQAEDTVRNAEDAAANTKDVAARQYDAKHPAKCYLALGGDTRKQSQRHETYALEAIGSSINIQSIWCDKLVNEAEEGVVTDQKEMTKTWARNLLEKEYDYVLVAQADEDILYAVSELAPGTERLQPGETCVLKVMPAGNTYGVELIRQ